MRGQATLILVTLGILLAAAAARGRAQESCEVCHGEQAIEFARSQGARSWELRATMSLSRLLRDQGRREEAREVLAAIYGWFSGLADSSF